tara:strand:+ start:28550 stop:28990 length:441 start_codon:yes stop_codon:yes gene_type:complete
MNIEKLIEIKNSKHNKKLSKAYNKMQCIIEALNTREISIEILNTINTNIKLLNTFSGTEKEIIKIINKTYSKILSLIKKELKLVPKHHYRNLWMLLGMSFGVAFSPIIGNSGNAGIGISMGMLIGVIIGTNLDKNAKEVGNQLDFE